MLGLVGGAPGGETPRVADSLAAGTGRFFHNSVPPSKLNRLGNALAAGKTLGIPRKRPPVRLPRQPCEHVFHAGQAYRRALLLRTSAGAARGGRSKQPIQTV